MNTQTTPAWDNVIRFNFTYAIPGGAWLEFGDGHIEWHSFSTIGKHKPQAWIDRHLKKQGWMTGCWVDTDDYEARIKRNNPAYVDPDGNPHYA